MIHCWTMLFKAPRYPQVVTHAGASHVKKLYVNQLLCDGCRAARWPYLFDAPSAG